jgi:peroxin-1
MVNQTLTYMDGAKCLDSVHALAATSRPDLINPALRRPGHLDKNLLSDMPNDRDRVAILRTVGEKLHLQPFISSRLTDIAIQTDHFSSADPQALMHNARLEAIHDLLGQQQVLGYRKISH